MRQDLRNNLLAGALCAVLWPGGQPIALGGESLTLAVLIDNVAHVPQAILKKTQLQAADVFRHAGIGTRWLECSFQEAEHRDPPGCQLPLDVPVVIVKILPKAEAQRWSGLDGGLGFCLSKDAYVLFPRAQAVAQREGVPISLVLAHTLAHEVGHSLLGAGHRRDGLMRGVLRTSEWRLAAAGQLLFTPPEARDLREGIRKLIAPQSL